MYEDMGFTNSDHSQIVFYCNSGRIDLKKFSLSVATRVLLSVEKLGLAELKMLIPSLF